MTEQHALGGAGVGRGAIWGLGEMVSGAVRATWIPQGL